MLQLVFQKKLTNNILRFFTTKIKEFEEAQQLVKKLNDKIDSETHLKLYGLYKQVFLIVFNKNNCFLIKSNDGDIFHSQSDNLNLKDKAKYDAWKLYKNLSKDEARCKYIDLVNNLMQLNQKASTNFSSTSKDVIFTESNKVFRITLNRPTKFNALTYEMYEEITKALDYVNKKKDIALTVLTGNGNYFCSGNDLSNFNLSSLKNIKDIVDKAEEIFSKYVHAYIVLQKPLIVLVNGPAIGIAVTVLGLADYVIASDKATFSTPFTSLGQSPEGCSSYTFPLLMGAQKANEMLIFGKKLTAEEALKQNLVAQVIPANDFVEKSEKIINQFAKLPIESLNLNKQLIRQVHKNTLIDINVKESAFLKQRWLSKEFQYAMMNFLNRK